MNFLGLEIEKHAPCSLTTEPASLQASEHYPIPCSPFPLNQLRKLRLILYLGLCLSLKFGPPNSSSNLNSNVPFHMQNARKKHFKRPFVISKRRCPRPRRLLRTKPPVLFLQTHLSTPSLLGAVTVTMCTWQAAPSAVLGYPLLPSHLTAHSWNLCL